MISSRNGSSFPANGSQAGGPPPFHLQFTELLLDPRPGLVGDDNRLLGNQAEQNDRG
jgi:hypothetical protein